jgi:methyl coenzyme M reductase subunit D
LRVLLFGQTLPHHVHAASLIGRRLHHHAEMFDRIIGEPIEDTPAVGEIDRRLGERLEQW